MTREQTEKFAIGYPVTTDWVVVLLDEYDDDINKVHSILCKSKEEIAFEVNRSLITDMK